MHLFGQKQSSLKKFAAIKLNPFVSASMEINEIGLNLCCDESVLIQIFRDDNFEVPIYETVIDTVSNEWTYFTLDNPLCFGFTDGNDSYSYYVVYEIPEGCKVPKSKMYSCDCGFDTKKKKHRFLNFFNATSLTVDSIEDLEDCKKSCSIYSHGLRFKSCLSCDMSSWLCGFDFEKSFDPSSIEWIIAKTIQLASVLSLGEQLLFNPKCSPYSIVANELLPEHLSLVDKDYNNNITWIAENAPHSLMGCFECRQRIRKTTII